MTGIYAMNEVKCSFSDITLRSRIVSAVFSNEVRNASFIRLLHAAI